MFLPCKLYDVACHVSMFKSMLHTLSITITYRCSQQMYKLQQNVENGWYFYSLKSVKMTSLIKTKVLVIGAGIAGLSAAKKLYENNIDDFLVIEAQDYVGGRIKSEICEDGVVEYGAQWLHGIDNNLKKFADECNLLSTELSREGCGKFLRSDGFIFDDMTVAKVDFVVGEILSRCEDLKNTQDTEISVGDYLEREFNDYIATLGIEASLLWQQLFQWHLKFQAIDNSCESLKELSAARWGDYDFNGDENQSHINFKNGYSTIVKAILSGLPENKIWLNSPVSRIIWKDCLKQCNAEVICSDGRVVNADHVICTVSLGVLKAKHEHMFCPPLPRDIVTAIESLGFGAVGKIILQFEYPWWGDTEGFQIVSDLNDQESKWYNDISGFDVLNVGTDNTMIGWIGSRGAKVVESLTDKEVAYECLKLLKNSTGLSIAPLKSMKRSQWYSNPYVRGGYSHTTLQCNVNRVLPSTLLRPVEVDGRPVLLFAGEACHDTHFSTTHGAFETGETQAQHLVDYISGAAS